MKRLSLRVQLNTDCEESHSLINTLDSLDVRPRGSAILQMMMIGAARLDKLAKEFNQGHYDQVNLALSQCFPNNEILQMEAFVVVSELARSLLPDASTEIGSPPVASPVESPSGAASVMPDAQPIAEAATEPAKPSGSRARAMAASIRGFSAGETE